MVKKRLSKFKFYNHKKITNVSRESYEKRHENELIPLVAIFSIVPRKQEDFFIDKYNEIGASLNIILYAYSNPPLEVLSYLGDIQNKKSIILTLTRKEYENEILDCANKRFNTSDASKGIAFSFELSHIAGILPYKFISDIAKDDRLKSIK